MQSNSFKMRWSSRNKRQVVTQDKSMPSSSSSLREQRDSGENISAERSTEYSDLQRTSSRQSIHTVSSGSTMNNSNVSKNDQHHLDGLPNSQSNMSISSNTTYTQSSLSQVRTVDSSSNLARGVSNIKLGRNSSTSTGTTSTGTSTTNGRTFNSSNYDQTVLKTGWVNKGSDIQNHNHTNSDSWRIYKAELKGPTLSLFKLPNDLNIRSFDPSFNQLESAQSNQTSIRQKRLSAAPSKSNLQKSDLKTPMTPGTPTSSNESTYSDGTKNFRVKLKYLSESYPHPDLQLNSSNSIVSGTLESICHTILFNTLDDNKLSYNLLLILPLFGDIKASLKYFIEYSLTFTSQRIYKNNPTVKVAISYNTDDVITDRLGLIINTLVETFPGMLLDEDLFELMAKLLMGVSHHSDQLADRLRKDVIEKEKSMKQLTSFKTVSFDPNLSSQLTNVDSFLSLDSTHLAQQINIIDLRFNKAWNPKHDPSLLYEIENLAHPRLNPLIFNSTSNLHYLGRLLVSHLFGSPEAQKSEAKRANILSKWIEIGCIFDKIGDMVSWLAIATAICSIPILRLKKSWSLVDEKFLKIITTEWAPVVFELDRRTMTSEASHRSSYHVIAPQGLGVTYSKEDVVPYFGDLTVKFTENSTLKHCEKKVQRVKVSFSRWDEYLQNVKQDDALFQNTYRQEDIQLQKQLYNLLTNHVQSQPLTQESMMALSLSVESDAFGSYHKQDTRTPLITGSYLPTLFSEITPRYRLFNQDVLIGASGYATLSHDGTSISASSGDFAEDDIQKVTGVNNVDVPSYNLNSNIPSSKQHKLLKSVRDIFNIGSDVFHIDDDLIFKSVNNKNELRNSRPASVVLENPSSKRLSQLSKLSGTNRDSAQIEGVEQEGDDVFAVLDDASILNSLVKPLNVVLKAGTFERMIDVLVLTSNVFSKNISRSDIDAYLAKSSKLDSQFLKLKMNNGVYTSTFFTTYRSFSTTSALLEALTRRFNGAKSAALSIANFQYDDVEAFPDWDGQVSPENTDLNWKFVGSIQIGVLEALLILITDHYNDFTDDLRNKSIFVELLKMIDNEIVVEWKEVLLRFEDSVELKNDYNDIYNVLSNLYKKIRKSYIKKCYRPLDLLPKGLPNLNERFTVDLEGLSLPKDFRDAEVFVDHLDWLINELFVNTTIDDWNCVYQLLEIESTKSLTSLFKYKWDKNPRDLDRLVILDVFKWLNTLFAENTEDKVLDKFPPPVKLLFEVHSNLEKYFKLQIADVLIGRDVRTARMVSILQILTISRLRMKSVDLFEDGSSLIADQVSPHVPSFIESAIVQAIVSPESRLYVNSWIYSSSALKDQQLDTIDALLDMIPDFEVDDLTETLKVSLTPCIGWFTERLLEISNYVPNMSIENSKLINFDKRRFTYNLISNIIDLNSNVTRATITTTEAAEIRNKFEVVYKLKHFADLDFNEVHDAAVRENHEYPKDVTNIRLFKSLIDTETDKIRRDNEKKETLSNQERDIKRTKLLSQARASLSLSRESSHQSEYQNNLRRGRQQTHTQSPSKVSGVGKRLGGLFNKVRPFSISVGNSWSGNDKVVHPADLPDVTSIDHGVKTKPYLQIKLFNYKPLFVHSGIEGFFKLVCETGGEDYSFQAISNQEAQSWLTALNLSKRYNYLSKDSKGLTGSKLFGVPIANVCEREGTFVPTIVERLLQEIELRGLNETGLYRIPGSVGSINLLKQAFDEGGDFTLEDDRWFEVNTLAGCLKSYLRELPETLFTVELLPEFVEATKYGDLVTNLTRLTQELPAYNYHLLKRLFEHLNKVIQHSEKNRMDAVNLAIVFSMSFLNNDALGASMGSDLGALQTILQHLIKDPYAVFSPQFEPAR